MRKWIVVFVVIWLAGCSTLKLAYNHSPSWISYQLDVYLDLDDAQESALSAQLEALHAWHRRHVLPDYAQTLREWSQQVSSGHRFSVEDVLNGQQRIERELLRIGSQISSEITPIVQGLKPSQIERLKAKLEKSNREYQNKYLSASMSESRRRKERIEELEERYENWLGRLTREQKSRLSSMVDQQLVGPRLWAEERQARQQALLRLIEESRTMPGEQVQRAWKSYFDSLSTYRVPELESRRPLIRSAWAEVTADVLNMMTDQQRQFLQQKLLGYANDFQVLLGQSK
jgi:hypothetical protein